MGYLVGVDVGTSGIKAVVCDEEGRLRGRGTVEYPLHTPRPGWAEQDPEDWWRGTVQAIGRALLEAGVSGAEVRGVGLSGQMHGSVLLDASGRVLRPPILWCDVRTAGECREIEARIGRAELIRLTGNAALEGFTAPKLLWVQRHEPEIFARIACVLLPKDYVRYRLTGELATEVSDAAGTLLFDVSRGAWAEPVLKALGIPREVMPPVYGSWEVCGHLTPEAARQTGLPPQTPVVAGGADNACGAVGAGVVTVGRALSSIGSSGVIFVPTDRPAVDPQGRVHSFNHTVPQHWYLMGVMLAAGLSLRWVRDELGQVERAAEQTAGIDAYDLLGRQAAQAPPGSLGLFFLPYLNGERTPHGDANARGVWLGLSTAHRRPHLVRSVFEGITFGLRDSLELIRGLGIFPAQVRAIGGGAKSPFWRQLQADILGVEVAMVNVDEGPALGAALLAGVGSGAFAGVAEAAEATVRVVETVLPDPERSRRYEDYYAFYRSLYPALQDRFAAVVPLQEA